MSILEHPPIDLGEFLSQTYADSEYLRRLKPDGSEYLSRDEQTGQRCHGGFDLQTSLELEYAVEPGIAEHANFGAPLGIVTVLRTERSGYRSGFGYAHQERRLVGDGRHVEAGTPLGEEGGTGGVADHLHFFGLRVWNDYSTLFNIGPMLRASKGVWMEQLDRIESKLDKVFAQGQRLEKVLQASVVMILKGSNFENDLLPDTPYWEELKPYANRHILDAVKEA